MAVDLHMLTTMEGGDDNKTVVELTTPTIQGGEDVEVTIACSSDRVEVGASVYKKGAWSKEEDEKLIKAVEKYGVRNWVTVEKFSGLSRPAKNCRLRWLNYLRPNLKKYPFTQEEEKLILLLHSKYGNSWSRIASKLPGRSDNEIKNFWHKRAKKYQKQHHPICPTKRKESKQSHAKEETNADDKNFQNYHDLILPPTSIQVGKAPIDASSTIHSPQTLISTSQQSELTYRTTPSPHTPTSQNLHLSPHQRRQSSSSAFIIPLIEPPVLSSPQGRFKRFLTPQNQVSISVSPHSVANASTFLPQHSSPQIQCLSNMKPPTSHPKLKLSPSVPQQTTDCPGALLSPLSPFKLCLSSIPICSESNLSIPHSSNVQLNSSTPAQLSSPIQPMVVDTNNVIPQYSSLETKVTPIQFDLLEIGEINSSMNEVESDSNLKIMEELREAQARVKFLKKMLRHKRISKKKNLRNLSRRKVNFLDENPKTNNLYVRELRTQVPLGDNSSEIARKECLSSPSSRKKYSKNILGIGGDIIIEHRLSKLQDVECSMSEKYTENSIESKKVATQDEASIENSKSLQKAEDSHSIDEFLEIKNLQEQRHSINLFDHPNSEKTMNALKSDSWDNKLCAFQVPGASKCFNGWSTLDELVIESSTLLQDSFLTGDLFDQRSGIEQPFADGFGIVYNQSTATTLIIEPGDESSRLSNLQPNEGGCFGDNVRQEDASFVDGNLARPTSCEANLLLHRYPTTDLQESQYLVSQPMMEHESEINLVESSKLCEPSLLPHQYPTTNLLDSNYLLSKQIMEQEFVQGEQFSFQTFGGGSLAETSKLYESTLSLHHNPVANMIDSMYQGCLNDNYARDKQHTFQTSYGGYCHGGIKTDSISREMWKQEPSREESLMEGLLVENLWLEEQMVSQDQTLLLSNRFDPIVRQSRMTDLTESKSWNNEFIKKKVRII